MKRWLADVTIQTRTKSYPHRATVRVEAGRPDMAFKRAYLAGAREHVHAIKGRQIDHVTIRLCPLGIVKVNGREDS